jgi:hypothetical protein
MSIRVKGPLAKPRSPANHYREVGKGVLISIVYFDEMHKQPPLWKRVKIFVFGTLCNNNVSASYEKD